jgi:O-methyltransferase
MASDVLSRRVLNRVRSVWTGRANGSSSQGHGFKDSLDEADRALIEKVRPYTLTSAERIMATLDSVDYIVRRGIPGALVECGVWRGGSVLTMIMGLQRHNVFDRDVYLYDTFEGMTAPSDLDTSAFEDPAITTWSRASAAGQRAWDYFFGSEVFGLDQVRELVLSTGYPPEKVHFEVGAVAETLPARAPDEVALLRLDTDFYDSTRHELVHLYPRLVTGGVLIVDDYGHWDGCRRAVDDYFRESAPLPLLSRIDYTGRTAVKH